MTINVLMPALSPTMTEGNLAKWHKKEGDTVKAGEVIAEIETDKATMEVEAVDEGKLGKILIPAGTQGVKVNEPIAILLEEGENDNALKDAGKADAPKAAAAPAPVASPAPVSTPAPQAKDSSAAPQNDKGVRIFATPLAKRLAREANLDLSKINGSGPKGRIVKADVLGGGHAAAKAPQATAGGQAAPVLSGDEKINAFGQVYTELPVNNIKKITAKRLLESKTTVPHFYLTIDCRIDDLLATRKMLNEGGKEKLKISVNDFVVKACAMALKAYPAANVSWMGESIHQFKTSDISVAVATPNGLMTPIVKRAEEKGLAAISSEIKDLAGRARDGKLKPEEFQGGSFTVSNLGMYGITNFQAIINPPQSCILAVGAGQERPYVENGEVKIGTFMSCTLSTDHRTVDGAVGAEFLQILKRYIETPASMLL